MRSCGVSIGIDNSSMNRFLEHLKTLRLPAILQEANGHIQEYYEQGWLECFVIPNNFFILSSFTGLFTGNVFCWYTKLFRTINFLLEC